MSEFGGGSSEVSESTEVNETPPEETGGESSEATQEAATEEANESGGFDDAEDTEAPDSNEDTEDIDSEDDGDESQDVGFEDGEDVDNTDSQPDDAETYEDDNISDADEDQIGFDDSEETDEVDDSDIEDEDPEADPDGNEADEDPDGSPDGDPDGDPEDDTVEDDLDADEDFDDEEDAGELEDYSDDSMDGDPEDDTVEDDQDVDDDGDIQDEEPEADPDGNEADEDPDGSPDGDPDGDPEDDTVEDDQDVDDDGDIQDEDPEADPDGNEADEDPDGSPDGDPDGDPEDDTVEDDQDVDDDGDIQDEEPEANPDGNEADEDPDGSPDGDLDGDPEDDTVEDDLDADEDFDDEEDAGELEDYSDDSIDGDPEDDTVEDDQDVDDDGDIQDEDPEADPDGNDADEDPDGSPDGDPDGNPEDDTVEDDQNVDDDADIQDEDPKVDPDGNEADEHPDGDSEDDTIEDDQDIDDDFDDEEDTGELEDYSDDPETNADSTDEAEDEAERDQDKEELAEEKANEEAAEEAEHAVSEDANKLAEDEADPVEDENQKSLESQPEDSAEKNESGNESNENGHMDDTPEEENKPEEDIDSESEDDLNDELEDSEEYQDEGEPENYDDEKPVDPVSDTKDDQEAPSETDADDKVSKTAEESEKEDAYRTAMNNMADYLNSHNYGREDYAEYSKDPEWQKLNADLQRSLGMEVSTDVPETSTPSPEGGKEVSSTELPDNCVVVNASDIDMTYAQGMDSDQFWNHHGNTKEDYMRVAEKLPDVQQALDSGKSIDELKNDPELGDTVRAYYDPDNMIKVEQQPDGSYSFTDDGRHRIAAAQELGYEIPVDVTNAEKPVDSQSNTKISDIPSDHKNNLDGGDGPDDPPPPPEGGDGPDNPPPPPDGGDGPGGPPEKEFGKEQLNVAAHGDGQIWVKSSDIKDKLDSIGRPDLSAKVDEAIDKLKSGGSKASEEFVSAMREAGNELRKNEDTVDCGNALLNLVDNDAQALKVEAENGTQEYKGLVQENNKQVEGASEAPNPDDLNRKQDIGSETRENLGSFEQSKWDNLSQVEKEQAVEKLRDSIAEDLQLENKPNIAYYYKESPSDFGGYAASTNTIYINRFNMDNAGETADTIAHESRHCWQHERAENPQTEQDYKFKENFEDYIRPEDDFYEYQCQPVEADARDYAQEVKDAIPKQNEASESNIEQDDSQTYKKIEDAPPSETGPPDTSEKKETVTVSELPDDFEGKIKEQPKFKALSERAEQKCAAMGLDKESVQKIREIEKGQKPNPEQYLGKEKVEQHLQKFEKEGCYKFIKSEPNGTIGTRSGIYVTTGAEAKRALAESNGDPRKLEQALGLNPNDLGNDPYVVRIDNPQNLRMSDGNEPGTLQNQWCPGGTTSGGVDEAIVDAVPREDYSYKPCFENGKPCSIDKDDWN